MSFFSRTSVFSGLLLSLLGILLAGGVRITGQVVGGESTFSLAFFVLTLLGFLLVGLGVHAESSDLEDMVEGDAYDHQSQEAYERFMEVKRILTQKGDEVGLSFLRELARDASEYVQIVAKMERQVTGSQLFRLELPEYQDTMRNIETQRTAKHNALISQLEVTNRYLMKHYKNALPSGGVYTLPQSSLKDRTAIGDWAGYLQHGLAYNE